MNSTAINAYKNVGIDSSVAGADPHKLILLLYQGALLAISTAKNHMMRKNISAKWKAISHAILIIESGLKTSLDKNAGGELAQNLAALYDYMNQRLLFANLKNDVEVLDEVSGLLSELQGAWEAIRPEVISEKPNAASAVRPQVVPQNVAPARPQPAPAMRVALTYGRI